MDHAANCLGGRNPWHVTGDAGTISIGIERPVSREGLVSGLTGVEKEGALFCLEDCTAGKIVNAWRRRFLISDDTRDQTGLADCFAGSPTGVAGQTKVRFPECVKEYRGHGLETW